MRRSEQRREATFAIYQRELTGRPLAKLLVGAKPFTRALAEGTDEHLAELDAEIGAYARGWSLERIAPLEKAIMRVALYEIHYRDDIPTPVAIDEAVAIAGRYCGNDAPGFVNGILAAASSPGDESPTPA
jgi:N utilization substance protein B